MRIAFVGAEAFPFVKIGGLGDVVGALPRALARLGLDVTVYLPWYAHINAPVAGRVVFGCEGHDEEAGLGELRQDGVRWVFIGLGDFARHGIYGYWDDTRRFVRFSLAAAAAIDADVVHAHDWQAGLVPALAAAGRLRAPTIFTVHNIGYQGRLSAEYFFRWTGLPWSMFHMDGLEYHGEVNLQKAGIVYSHRVTTVSPTHAWEMTTPDGGFGLDGVMRKHQGKLIGILNGIDEGYWNPATDPFVAENYSDEDGAGKLSCEQALASELDLRGPILGVVSRLAHQKGVDLVLGAMSKIFELGFSLAVLGAGEAWLEEALTGAARSHPGRVAFRCGLDEALAHRIYAGSEAILVPSRYEPCGLTQMIAQRYGSPPIARSVGGLSDSIEDGRTGLLFAHIDPGALAWAIERFARLENPRALGYEGMRRDFSWDVPAKKYADLYREVVKA